MNVGTNNRRRFLRREIIIHVVFWVLYITNEVASYYLQSNGEYSVGDIIVKELVLHIPIIGAFYLNYSFLIPRYLLHQRHAIFTIWLVAIFPIRWVLYYFISIFLDWYFDSGTMFIDYVQQVWPSIIIATFFYLLISTGAKFSRDWFYNRKRIEELERQKREAELALLQYQINPHFLFNTLNNIYSLVNRHSERAAEAILMFSQIMRYAMNDVFAEEVELKHEIDYLQSFVELQQLRFTQPDIVHLEVQGDADGMVVSPMLLIPFVENAFKHGSVASSGEGIDIRLVIIQSTLHFSVRNEIKPQEKDSTGGIGLANVKRRLELLYPEKHSLSIQQTNGLYTVELTIDTS